MYNAVSNLIEVLTYFQKNMQDFQQNSHPVVASSNDEDGINLLDLVIILAKHKKTILIFPLVVAIVVAGISLLSPDIYTATARIMPPQQQQSTASAMLGQLAGLAGGAGASALGLKNPNDLYVSMLKSRTVADAIILRFKLKELYEQKTMAGVYKALESVTKVSAGKDGLITVEVDDKIPQRAADMANAYVDELHELTKTLAVSEASRRRLFFERQLHQVKDRLAGAEMAMKQTQENTGVLELGAQGRAMVEAVGEIRAQIAAKEVQLAAMRTFATTQNPDYIHAQGELAGLRGQLSKFERGGEDGLVPVGKLPEVGVQSVRRLRELKYYETLFELMAKQYELAKMDEAKEASIIQVLDKAVAPDRKSRPKRMLTVIVYAFVAGFIAVLWVFFKEVLGNARKNPVQAEKINALRNSMAWNSK